MKRTRAKKKKNREILRETVVTLQLRDTFSIGDNCLKLCRHSFALDAELQTKLQTRISDKSHFLFFNRKSLLAQPVSRKIQINFIILVYIRMKMIRVKTTQETFVHSIFLCTERETMTYTYTCTVYVRIEARLSLEEETDR